jgi:hypothetical protein
MRIEKRTMNWLPKPSLYHEQATKRAKQRAANQTFMNNQSGLANAIGGIMTANSQEQSNIVSRIAMSRLGIRKTA